MVAVGVNVTLVPGQNEPDGLAANDTLAVTGDVIDSDPKLVPLAPVVIPATPVATDALMAPADADVVVGCTCKPVIVTWSAPLLFTTVTFIVSDVAVIEPDTPVMLEPVI